jgi:hypothetical protein
MDIRAIIEQAGGEHPESRTYGDRALWYFRDPQTGTTLGMYETAITGVEDVQKHLENSRAKFGREW